MAGVVLLVCFFWGCVERRKTKQKTVEKFGAIMKPTTTWYQECEPDSPDEDSKSQNGSTYTRVSQGKEPDQVPKGKDMSVTDPDYIVHNGKDSGNGESNPLTQS
jgi:hypothetical protein